MTKFKNNAMRYLVVTRGVILNFRIGLMLSNQRLFNHLTQFVHNIVDVFTDTYFDGC